MKQIYLHERKSHLNCFHGPNHHGQTVLVIKRFSLLRTDVAGYKRPQLEYGLSRVGNFPPCRFGLSTERSLPAVSCSGSGEDNEQRWFHSRHSFTAAAAAQSRPSDRQSRRRRGHQLSSLWLHWSFLLVRFTLLSRTVLWLDTAAHHGCLLL